ncbi:MAG: 1-(5-phosphoribosyl)-5-((5-phosphoribosylamino)methylideneamino)imidazole-4-carboxamide isomerase [Xanthomonadales bacterium]|nr:1-(5-phosphoribosyl)-5-[(5-phosphoribosylamino)methylideneamino] imidazole-4-carboxamide isomerase [Xanthomonadales bacterium]NIX13212.1 1-(5-phosphoribosyl)-5-((5-phosphoribosylamino)methylideneamino)imidazole-4-carboxamide isomerase [Xanthomonadales bacterium]
MQLIPAIDLLDGRCVRLRQGDFGEVTFYGDDPSGLAEQYAADGAPWLHVVDLAASRDGTDADTSPLFSLLEAATQKVQTGGGVRESADVESRLDAGANRVVVGSVCASEPERFARWLKSFGSDTLVAALDVRIDGTGRAWPRIHGWTRDAGRDLHDLLDELTGAGLRHLLCTDIGRDGAMRGPNLALYRDLARHYPALQIQASGGVSRLEDLRDLRGTGAASVITGKALLEGAFSVPDALGVLA